MGAGEHEFDLETWPGMDAAMTFCMGGTTGIGLEVPAGMYVIEASISGMTGEETCCADSMVTVDGDVTVELELSSDACD